MPRQLDETILDGGIRNTYFFNGRWLTAEDLRTEQEANREHQRQLGRAVGEGVVQGLEVELADAGSGGRPPRVTVSAGLALNRRGETLSLAQGVELALARQEDPAAADAGLFAPCAGPTGDLTLTGAGAYVLAVCPASGFRERAPGRELGDEVSLAGCGSRYAVEGLRFHMVRLPLGAGSGLGPEILDPITALMDRQDDLGRSLLRNHLAHLCLGTAGLAGQELDPFGTPAGAPFGIDALRGPAGLGDGDVPLALLVWTAQGVRAVDPWAVRRQAYVDGPGPAYDRFDPRLAAGRARLLQFHDHLRVLLQGSAAPSTLKVEQAFRFLPPAGVIPLTSARFARGFSAVRFFESFAGQGARAIRSGQVAGLLWESLLHPAVDLEHADFLQIYEVKESKDAQGGSQPPQPYLVFAAGTLRYLGAQPRFPHLCRTLTETRDAYRGLLTHRVFDTAEEPEWSFPNPMVSVASTAFNSSARAAFQPQARLALNLGSDSLFENRFAVDPSAVSIFTGGATSVGGAVVSTARDDSYQIAAILDVVSTAGGWGAVACAALTDPERILEALRNVYQAQKELVGVLDRPQPGAKGVTKPQDFARQLRVYLDDRISASQPALGPALDQGNANAALGAQDAINRFVATWSGDLTVGNLRVLYQKSSRGRTLVPGDANPFEYIFEVQNLTNRELDVQLAAEVLPPHQDWTLAVRAFDATGVESPFIRLAAGREHPDDPKTAQEVRLSLVTPPGAALGQTATLRLRAFVPSPVSVAAQDAAALAVGDHEVPEVETGVRFTGPPNASSSLSQARVGNPVELTFNVVFHTSAAPATRGFRLRLQATSTGSAAFYTLEFPAEPIQLQSDTPHPVITQIVPKAGAVGKPLSFIAIVESVDGSVPPQTAGPFQVTTVQQEATQ